MSGLKTTQELLEGTPVCRLVIHLGIPAMFGQLFNILYNIVDRIFIGKIPETGSLSLASIGVCAPALTSLTAFTCGDPWRKRRRQKHRRHKRGMRRDSCGKSIGNILRRYTILQRACDRMAERIIKAGSEYDFDMAYYKNHKERLKEAENMGNIKKDVFLGTKESQNKKFELLAKMAQPEIWTYKKVKDTDPYRILRNYIFFTYNRLDEENKILTSEDGEYRCMNTGLLTVYNQEIIALFKKSGMAGGLPWYLVGFFKETDKQFTMCFSQIPPLANYCNNVKELIYDSSLELNLRKEHIIDDNIDRFIEAGYADKMLINVLLDAAKGILEKKLKRNFKLALPFYYHNTETGENKIQLLAPLYFPGAPVKLALVMNKVRSDANEYYEGVTVLPVEWAYMNSRLIVKPDEEWAKIMEEVDTLIDETSIQNSIDKDE